MGRVKFTSILVKKWVPETIAKLDTAVLESAQDIERIAGALAPRDTGNLIGSSDFERTAIAQYVVKFGGRGSSGQAKFDVPYARMRHYRNSKNPQTLRYLERAGEAVARNFDKYIRDAL